MVFGVIGGSGFYSFPELDSVSERIVDTPYSDTPVKVSEGVYAGKSVFFLARHGGEHRVPPHKVNYRANIWAFKQLGVEQLIAINAVGGIDERAAPGMLVIPDQVIDYTYGRDHTFFSDFDANISHIEFADPFDSELSCALHRAAKKNELPLVMGGTYGCTQGPRLETKAEISRLKNDGCGVVGMTLMPEASLAREQELKYVSICVVANWAAGISDEPIALSDIMSVLELSVSQIRELILKTISFS